MPISAATTDQSAAELAKARRYVPWLVAVALFMENLDATIVNTAVPTMAASLPGFTSWFWMGMVAPKGTPTPVVDKLREAYQAAVNDPATRQRLVEAGVEPQQTSAAEMDAFVRSEAARWGQVIKDAQIQLD